MHQSSWSHLDRHGVVAQQRHASEWNRLCGGDKRRSRLASPFHDSRERSRGRKTSVSKQRAFLSVANQVEFCNAVAWEGQVPVKSGINRCFDFFRLAACASHTDADNCSEVISYMTINHRVIWAPPIR